MALETQKIPPDTVIEKPGFLTESWLTNFLLVKDLKQNLDNLCTVVNDKEAVFGVKPSLLNCFGCRIDMSYCIFIKTIAVLCPLRCDLEILHCIRANGLQMYAEI